MLYVVLDINGEVMEKTCHLGAKRIVPQNLENNVVMVQADGDELFSVYDQIGGIRKADQQRVVKWFGDDAKFIANNIVL